jgi:hypothetical protein
MKISQPEHGGNGESAAVVNQWLPFRPLAARRFYGSDGLAPPVLSRFQTTCCIKSSLASDLRFRQMNLFDCATLQSFSSSQGRKGRLAMIGTVTAVMGLVSAGIFLAHAFEGFRSRA